LRKNEGSHLKNKERDNEYKRVWYQNNRRRHREKHIKWKQENPERARQLRKKSWIKRQRELGYFELWDNPFPDEIEVHFHHINKMLVIPMPARLHEKTTGRKNRNQHMDACNKIIEEIYGVDLERIIGDEI